MAAIKSKNPPLSTEMVGLPSRQTQVSWNVAKVLSAPRPPAFPNLPAFQNFLALLVYRRVPRTALVRRCNPFGYCSRFVARPISLAEGDCLHSGCSCAARHRAHRGSGEARSSVPVGAFGELGLGRIFGGHTVPIKLAGWLR